MILFLTKLPFLTLLFIFSTLSATSPAKPILYLSWDEDPTTTMEIFWIVPEQSSNKLFLKTTPSNWEEQLSKKTPLPMGQLELNHVSLKSLTPNTQYQFRLEDETELFSFQTAPDNIESKITFVEGGDLYHDDLETLAAMHKTAASFNPLFASLGGDIAYSFRRLSSIEREERWIAFLKLWSELMRGENNRCIPLVVAIGNHEVRGGYEKTPSAAPLFYTFFPFNSYRTLKFGKLFSLTLLDSNHTHPIDGEQSAWLESSLQALPQNSWKFATYHIPAFPSVGHPSGRHSKQIRKSWLPIFQKNGLHIAFEHHDHVLKRTIPIKTYPAGKPVLFLGDGSWGILNPRKPRVHPYIAFSKSIQAIWVVDVSQKAVQAQATSSNRHIIDNVTIFP